MYFYPLGDDALLINFEQKINREINQEVAKLTSYLRKKKVDGIRYYIPAYCSLTVGYDPVKWNFTDLTERIRRFSDKTYRESLEYNSRFWKIPVCYDPQYALDLPALASEKNVSEEQIVTWHLSCKYQVYMLGFLPGFVYLGDLPETLHCQRKKQPRMKVPAQSVALAGAQTGIYPSSAPGGWQIIGKTPLSIFNPENEEPFLFQMGDQVLFYQVDNTDFLEIATLDLVNLKKLFLSYES
ncbi:MAG: 5-oxoprolinase subunit PxpB [Saprospiraceae bacterium]|nr:5-oxoprolinase subunit PxpB [Saprospiraceae bacterium]